jgi:enoyl-CoA hydratase/carnithine racemase
MSQAIRTEKTGTTAHIVLSGDDSEAIVRGVQDACAAIADDRSVRAVIVRAAGELFATRPTIPDDPFGCLAALPQPVIAALHGDVSGGGLAMALACDIRICSDGASFSFSDVASGLVPAAGVTQRLPRLVGRGNALGLLLGGEALSAQDALRIGLVTEVVAGRDVLSRAQAIAARIGERGPLAIRYAKEAVQRGADMPLEQALRYETDLTVILQTTEDRAEGVRAFIAKDPPAFKGR